MNVHGRILLAGALWLCGCQSPALVVPVPDLSRAEPQLVAAVREYVAAVEAEPERPHGWRMLGDLYRDAEWREEAALCYEAGERLEPNAFEWPYLLGISLERLDLRRARAAYERAVAHRPSYAPAHVRLGRLHARLDDDEEARKSFQRAVELDPGLAHASLGLGQVALAEGDLDQAELFLRRALESEPRLAEAHRALAQTLMRAGQIERARHHALRADTLDPRTWLADPRAASQATANTVASLSSRAESAAAQGKLPEAIELYERAAASRPESVELRLRLGDLQLQDGQAAAAVEVLQEATDKAPRNANAWHALGKAYTALGRHALADSAFSRALEIDETHYPTSIDWARALAGRKEFARARQLLERTLENRPSDALAHMELGIVLVRSGNDERGLDRLQRAVELDPTDADAHFNLGVALSRQSRRDQAIRALREALRLNPDDDDARRQLQRLGAEF